MALQPSTSAAVNSANAAVREKPFISIRLRTLIALAIILLLGFGTTFWVAYTFVTDQAMTNLAHELTAIADTTAAGIDGDAHQALYLSDAPSGSVYEVDDLRYTTLVEWLALMQRTQGFVTEADGSQDYRVQLYTYVPSSAPGSVEFVGTSSAVKPPAEFDGAEFRATYEPQSSAMRNGFLGTTVNVDEAVTDEWGVWVSGFAPIRNSEGEYVGAVGVDLRDTTVTALQRSIRNALVPAFALTFLLLFGGAVVLANYLSRPLLLLTKAAKQIEQGKYQDNLIPQAVKGRFFRSELSVLGTVFEQMAAKVWAREEKLKAEVMELRIEVDRSKAAQAVAEITDTEFFNDLQSRAAALRDSRPRRRRDTVSD